MPKIIEMVGNKFNKLTVISKDTDSFHKNYHYKCKCDCGNTVIVCGNKLRSGHTKSCGCLAKEIYSNRCKNILSKLNTTHNASYHPLYNVWKGMMARCYDVNHMHYKNYGARGILVCNEWKNINNFINDMHPTYCENLTLERKDNNKGYSKHNCIWATKKEQCNNKRNNHKITMNDATKTITEWCEEYGIATTTVYSRIKGGELECENLFRKAWHRKCD